MEKDNKTSLGSKGKDTLPQEVYFYGKKHGKAPRCDALV